MNYQKFALILKQMVNCALLGSLPYLSSAQQFLNLDFERTSLDTNRAWGWEKTDGSNVQVILDKTVHYSGDRSLRVHSEAPRQQSVSYSMEPYGLKGRLLHLTGWIRTAALTGSASISLKLMSPNKGHRGEATNVRSPLILTTRDWQQVSVTASLPVDVESISIVLDYNGAGTAWFDDLVLRIDGHVQTQLAVDRTFSRREIKWLRRHTHELQTCAAQSVDDFSLRGSKDLEYFRDQVKDCQIIGMGESTHGTSEFFRLKHRILAYAVQTLGVRIFALEDNQLVVRKVNDFVMGGTGTARSSMQGLFGVWQNREMKNLIQWVRDYNDQHPKDKVSFVGFDMQDLFTPLDSLSSFLKQYLPELLDQVELLLIDIRSRGAQGFFLGDSIRSAWYNNALTAYGLVRDQREHLLLGAENSADSLTIYWGIQYARLVKQSTESLFRGHHSFYRDVAMAENVSWILQRNLTDGKMLLWAHDVHISIGQHTDPSQNIYGGLSMGNHLKLKFQEQYQAFGIWTHSGDYLGQKSYADFTRVTCPLYDAPVGSLEDALHEVIKRKNWYGLFIDLTPARNLTWLIRPLPTRFANHVNIEYGFWTRYSIPYQYDGIFFIDKTRAAAGY